ncbi:MAG: class I SAM-dependent methyltransferase, partial [Lachnospiraceae bacterium]|nr:class I SAM-dependent methyltransferase [Lachnospiraceae bacterium]
MDNKCDLTILQDGLSELGISLDETQIDQFVQYYELLIEWNSFMNLTAIVDWKDVCIKHFIDSLSLC